MKATVGYILVKNCDSSLSWYNIFLVGLTDKDLVSKPSHEVEETESRKWHQLSDNRPADTRFRQSAGSRCRCIWWTLRVGPGNRWVRPTGRSCDRSAGSSGASRTGCRRSGVGRIRCRPVPQQSLQSGSYWIQTWRKRGWRRYIETIRRTWHNLCVWPRVSGDKCRPISLPTVHIADILKESCHNSIDSRVFLLFDAFFNHTRWVNEVIDGQPSRMSTAGP